MDTIHHQLRMFVLILIGVAVIIALGVIALNSDRFFDGSANASATSLQEDQFTQESLNYQLSQLPSEAEPAETEMLLFFSETWDAHSARMESLLDELRGEGLELPVIKIDISENRALAAEYGVDNPPVLLLVGPDGDEKGRVTETNRTAIDGVLVR